MTIQDRIRNRRNELGLTLEDVANAVGVGKSTVRKWEMGMIKNMRRDKIAALAKVLRLSPSDFIDATEQYEFDLTPHECAHIRKYRSLDKHGKRTVDTVLDLEYDRCNDDFDADDIQILAAHVSDRPDINEPDR